MLVLLALLDMFRAIITPRPVRGRLRLGRYLNPSLWRTRRWAAFRLLFGVGLGRLVSVTGATRGGNCRGSYLAPGAQVVTAGSASRLHFVASRS